MPIFYKYSKHLNRVKSGQSTIEITFVDIYFKASLHDIEIHIENKEKSNRKTIIV